VLGQSLANEPDKSCGGLSLGRLSLRPKRQIVHRESDRHHPALFPIRPSGFDVPRCANLPCRSQKKDFCHDLPATFMPQQQQLVVVMHAQPDIVRLDHSHIPGNRNRVDGVPWRRVRFLAGRSDDGDEAHAAFPFQPALEVTDASGFPVHSRPEFRGIVLTHALGIFPDDLGHPGVGLCLLHLAPSGPL
jgi:hypothetical protein